MQVEAVAHTPPPPPPPPPRPRVPDAPSRVIVKVRSAAFDDEDLKFRRDLEAAEAAFVAPPGLARRLLSHRSYIQASHELLKDIAVGWKKPSYFWVLGPNLDCSFHYRFSGNQGIDLGQDGLIAAGIRRAHSLHLPLYEDTPVHERRLIFFASYLARCCVLSNWRSASPISALVVKHFPGGDLRARQELTEVKPFVCEDARSLEEWQDHLQPFADVFQCGTWPAEAVMMSHVCYPHLDAAIRAAEEDLQSSGEGEDRQDFVLGCTRVIPASLSPFMNRVLLRRRLGFRGITVTDWGQMGAIRSFVGDLTNFPADMHLLEPFSRLIICSVEAGNNFLLGCSECVDAHQVPPKIVEQVKQWAGTHPRWRQQLETLTLESFEWLRSKVLETDKPSLALPHETIALLIDPTNLHSLSVHDLVAFHLGYHIPNDRLQLIQSCIDTNNFDDVCQRGIVLVALFRYYYCKSLLQESDASFLTEPERSLLDFLCRPQCDPRQRHGENPQEWLQTVQQHPWYIAFCNTVDWGELDRRTDVVGELGSGELLRELEERAIAEAQRRLGSMERTAPKFF